MAKTRGIHVSDLPERPAYGVKLFCPKCRAEYSATRGDYFLSAPDTLMTCCDQPMRLVREHRVLEDV
jgi:hypothetical protein